MHAWCRAHSVIMTDTIVTVVMFMVMHRSVQRILRHRMLRLLVCHMLYFDFSKNEGRLNKKTGPFENMTLYVCSCGAQRCNKCLQSPPSDSFAPV